MARGAPRLALLTLAALLVAGCSQPAAPEPSAVTTATTPAATPAPTPAPTPVAPTAEPAPRLDLAPLRDSLAVAPGAAVTLHIAAASSAASSALDATLQARGEDGALIGEAPLRLGPGAETVVFLPVRAPSPLPDALAVTVRAVDAAGEELAVAPRSITLRPVDASAPAFAGGNDTLQTFVTLRDAATGVVYITDDPDLEGASFPRAADFHWNPNGPTRLGGEAVLPALVEALVGVRSGESRLVTISAGDGFPARLEDRDARDETLERERDVPLRNETAPRAAFDDVIRESGQGDPASFRANDTFVIVDESTGSELPYVVVAIDDARVTYRFAPSLGDRFTAVDAWANATEVVALSADSVRFRTTPPVELGATFTYHERWPDATVLASLNETTILLRHSPEVGVTWQQEREGHGFGPRAWRVDALTDDAILISAPSDHPLAGRALAFDLRIARVDVASG